LGTLKVTSSRTSKSPRDVTRSIHSGLQPLGMIMRLNAQGDRMALESIYSFLTYPKKHQPDEPLGPGTEISIGAGKLGTMLDSIFRNAEQDCVIPIMFISDGARQENPVRSDLLALMAAPSLVTASPLAIRLQRATSGTSGMGLMFICLGDDGGHRRIVISRFPADEGVVAERSSIELTVQFVEQVFLKNAYSYKAATFIAKDGADQLWKGHLVDRQINHGSKAVADYWIVDFLMSEFATTAAAGTKRLAIALRDASTSTSSLTVKKEIAAAANLAGNVPRSAMTIDDFCQQFHFSDVTRQAIISKVKPPRLVNERFRFDAKEFARNLAYKQIKLSNGALLTAPADRFEEVFNETRHKDEHTFSTTGAIIDERLRRIR